MRADEVYHLLTTDPEFMDDFSYICGQKFKRMQFIYGTDLQGNTLYVLNTTSADACKDSIFRWFLGALDYDTDPRLAAKLVISRLFCALALDAFAAKYFDNGYNEENHVFEVDLSSGEKFPGHFYKIVWNGDNIFYCYYMGAGHHSGMSRSAIITLDKMLNSEDIKSGTANGLLGFPCRIDAYNSVLKESKTIWKGAINKISNKILQDAIQSVAS